MRRALLGAMMLLLWCLSASGQSRIIKVKGRELELHVQGELAPGRVRALLDWAQDYVHATRTLSGNLPLARARVEIREIASTDASPVPWGQTLRNEPPVKVLLYVREGVAIDELRADWTAPHELAHLHHPYLGRSGRWVAEGLASYNQHRYMARAGVLSVEQAWEKLAAGFGRGANASQRGPIATLSHRQGGTMRIYWGGAVFWLMLDLRLRERGLGTLDALLDRYSQCCMRGELYQEQPEDTPADERVLAFLQALDALDHGKAEILALYRHHAALERFPELKALYAQLGLGVEAGAVRFDTNPRHKHLRLALILGTP